MAISVKDLFDEDVIESALDTSKRENIQTHFVYAGGFDERLGQEIQKGMKKYNIEKVMFTQLMMRRWKLITKERMENYCKENEYTLKISVNDDLEEFFEDIRLGKAKNYNVRSYFLPKLTSKGMNLVALKDPNYLKTFGLADPDVKEAEMKASESDSKYVRGECSRVTYFVQYRNPRKIFKKLKISNDVSFQ